MVFEGDEKKSNFVFSKGEVSPKLSGNFVEKFWGGYFLIEEGSGYCVKRLRVKPGGKITLQKHLHRSEHWVVVRGVARVTLEDDEIDLRTGESSFVGIGVIHRLENIGKIDLEIIEVQLGEYLGEDDIERFDEGDSRINFSDEEFCIGPDCGLEED